MWASRTKNDLAIEVWEKLDCENVGAAEIEAIETVIADQFGEAAVDSPMVIARLLADEGAELRHAELMELYVRRASDHLYDAAFQNIEPPVDLQSSIRTIRRLESLRRKFRDENDTKGVRFTREKGIQLKSLALEVAKKKNADAVTHMVMLEIAEWLRVWLQTPDVFEDWLSLRQSSADFRQKFGRVAGTEDRS
jgi:hypothetical protein